MEIVAILAETHIQTCGDCQKFHTAECHWDGNSILIGNSTCSDFEPKHSRRGRVSRAKKETHWKLDLYAPVPNTMKPCGFYGDTLTEAVWLPYREEETNEIQLRPTIITATKEGYKIVDFLKDEHSIKGTFPTRELQTLMQPQAVQILECKGNVEPRKIDEELDKVFNKHLEMPRAETILAKRWIEGTYFYDIFDAFPIENILGVSESGKSRLNMVNLALCYHAEPIIDPTEAGIFRSKEEDRVTLCSDEMEYLNNPHLYSTLRILINASYSKNSGYVTRYDEEDGKRVKRRFDLYSPMCIVGIGGLEGVTLSRAFRIVMLRVKKDYPKCNPNDYAALRSMLYVIRIRHAFELKDIYEKTSVSHIVTARFEELFKSFFALTRFMGTQEEYDILAEWCTEYQENFRTEALNVGEEETVLVALFRTEQDPQNPDWYGLKDITYRFNHEYFRQVSPKYTSNILYRLGLTKRKKVHGLTLIYAPTDLINSAAMRIGVSLSELLPPPSLPSSEQWKDALQK